MTEDEARAWLVEQIGVSRGTIALLEKLEHATVAANNSQNLIANSTIASFWSRHIVDSAQLLPLAAETRGSWIDLGSGAGFPGLVVAILEDKQITLVEVRRKRAAHLESLVCLLGLENRVTVRQAKVESLESCIHGVISARAFAPLDRLFAAAHHLADSGTLWLLPKGRSATSELEDIAGTWQGDFKLKQSITDPDAAIIVATDVHPRRLQ